MKMRAAPGRTGWLSLARRVVACLLAAAPLLGTATVLAAPGDGHRACTDHICTCMRHCAPSPKKKGHCHGDEATPGAQLQPGACRHGQEAVNPVATRPHVIPAPPAIHPEGDPRAMPAAPREVVLAGFWEIDLPPPRSRS
jgi:hypothetical protein